MNENSFLSSLIPIEELMFERLSTRSVRVKRTENRFVFATELLESDVDNDQNDRVEEEMNGEKTAPFKRRMRSHLR